MSVREREKWDRRYAEGYEPRRQASQLLRDWIDRLPKGRALDLACGLGRNAIFLAEHGFQVDAIDISRIALQEAGRRAAEKNLSINWIEADLDSYPLPKETYHLVLNSFYINRNLVPAMKEALCPGGFLLFEHHLLAPEPVEGPAEPGFRVRPNEPLRLFLDLHIIFYEEKILIDEGRKIAVARLVAFREQSNP